jgi:hypothetical protein
MIPRSIKKRGVQGFYRAEKIIDFILESLKGAAVSVIGVAGADDKGGSNYVHFIEYLPVYIRVWSVPAGGPEIPENCEGKLIGIRLYELNPVKRADGTIRYRKRCIYQKEQAEGRK